MSNDVWVFKPVSQVWQELQAARMGTAYCKRCGRSGPVGPSQVCVHCYHQLRNLSRQRGKAWVVCKVRGHRFAHRSRVDGYVYRSGRCFRCGVKRVEDG